MTISITRGGCTSEELHRMASVCKSVRHSRRIRAIAMVLDGVCRIEIAEAQGTTVRSIRDWVLRFNAHGPDGLADISAAVPTGRHAVLVLDGAGWHVQTTSKFLQTFRCCACRPCRFQQLQPDLYTGMNAYGSKLPEYDAA